MDDQQDSEHSIVKGAKNDEIMERADEKDSGIEDKHDEIEVFKEEEPCARSVERFYEYYEEMRNVMASLK